MISKDNWQLLFSYHSNALVGSSCFDNRRLFLGGFCEIHLPVLLSQDNNCPRGPIGKSLRVLLEERECTLEDSKVFFIVPLFNHMSSCR